MKRSWLNCSIVVLVACIMLQRMAVASPIQWTTSSGGNGHYYDVVFSNNPTWFDALGQAAALSFNGSSGHLATFTTRSEQEFVIQNLGGAPH
ncbi:hypothetical protein ACF1BQ_003065 [Bradyrhizobium sp. RDT10]